MLIESMIRETLGIKSHVVKTITKEGGELSILLDVRKRRRLACSSCGHLGRVRDRLSVRTWKHVPLWGIPVTLSYVPARVACTHCGKTRVEAIPWSQGKCRLSTGLIGLLSSWCKLLAWDVVAKLYGVHWNTVATAVRQAVAYGLEHRELGDVLYIGIDELSRQKGHVYVTNVYDLKEKRLLWSGEGRSQETLRAFFEEHGKALKQRVKAVCCDMWQPYTDMVKEHLPDATLVFDKFHIMQHLLKDAYHGEWDSEEDFAYDWWEQAGYLAQIPEELRCYIDWERVARDLFLDGFMIARLNGNVHVFSRY